MIHKMFYGGRGNELNTRFEMRVTEFECKLIAAVNEDGKLAAPLQTASTLREAKLIAVQKAHFIAYDGNAAQLGSAVLEGFASAEWEQIA